MCWAGIWWSWWADMQYFVCSFIHYYRFIIFLHLKLSVLDRHFACMFFIKKIEYFKISTPSVPIFLSFSSKFWTKKTTSRLFERQQYTKWRGECNFLVVFLCRNVVIGFVLLHISHNNFSPTLLIIHDGQPFLKYTWFCNKLLPLS